VTIGRISQLDKSTLLRIQAGCNFVNAEVARLRGRVTKVGVAVALAAIVVYVVMLNNGVKDPRLPIGGAFVVIALVTEQARRELKKSYKRIVVTRVVKAVAQGLTYSPESSFTKDDFIGMHLFDRRPEKWKSEDEVCGKKNSVTYGLHEIKASYMQKRGKHSKEIIIFKGLIVRLDFNKNFVGHTIVVQNAQSQVLGGLFGESENRAGKQLVRLESVDFEKQFSVYGTDQQEARYLLTPKLMELVMEAQALLGGPLRLSFHDNSLFVTVPQDTDRFEISLFGGPVSPESVVGDLVEVVSLAERLVETLELETRIWSRV
jgi:hypothetical protein